MHNTHCRKWGHLVCAGIPTAGLARVPRSRITGSLGVHDDEALHVSQRLQTGLGAPELVEDFIAAQDEGVEIEHHRERRGAVRAGWQVDGPRAFQTVDDLRPRVVPGGQTTAIARGGRDAGIRFAGRAAKGKQQRAQQQRVRLEPTGKPGPFPARVGGCALGRRWAFRHGAIVAGSLLNSVTRSAPAVMVRIVVSTQTTWESAAAWARRQLSQWQYRTKRGRFPAGMSTL